jgi:stage II sporulation protein D
MRKGIRYILMVLLLLLLPAVSSASPLVRIGIINGTDTVTISGQRTFQVSRVTDGAAIAAGRAGEKFQLSHKDGQLLVNNRRVESPVVVRLEPGDENEYITVNGRRYRGEIEVQLSVTKKGLVVIETLPLEEYIYGIIVLEISPAWSMEAVKAQAVAARTYALYHLGKHKKDGFDLCNTTDCQVYGGREAEDPRGNFAVDATRGMVVTYKTKLIPTFFHSSSGGYTENSENVWGNKTDYLRAVPDYDQNNPHYQWNVTFTTEEITNRLRSMGYKIGALQGVKVSPLHNGVNDAPDRGISGRVKSVAFLGSNQTVVLEGKEIRQIFKLNSTMFDILPTGSQKLPSEELKLATSITIGTDKVEAKQTIEVTAPVKKKKKKKKQQQKVPEKAASVTAAVTKAEPVLLKSGYTGPVTHLFTGAPATTLVTFEGRGFGHGLGMSQWGAKAMAEKGPQDDCTYYLQILKHYYQGVDIIKWY